MNPSSIGPSTRADGYRLAAAALTVLAVAAALRLGHLAALESSFEGTSLFSLARADAAHHWDEARQILDGDSWILDRVPWKGPGYSWFLAGLMKLFGESPGALRWPLALLGALNCAALVLLARRVLSVPWSLVAGLLAAVNGTLIFFDGELLFPTLLVTLNLPVLYLLGRRELGLPGHALAGALLGLAALVHPVYLAPAGLLLVWIARRRLRRAAAFGIAVALLVAPVTLTNVLSRGEPVLISWNGGINLYVGNQPAFDQFSGNRTAAWERIMQTPLDAGIERESERDRLYYRLAVRQALHHPLAALTILGRKAVALLSPVEYASNIRIYELREHSPVLAWTLGHRGPLWWPFGLWAPAALLGLAVALRRRRALDSAVALWSLGLALSMLIFFVTARYRAPIVFFGSLWVAQALAAAAAAWRGRRPRGAAVGAVAFVAIAALLMILAVPQRGFPLPSAWDEAAARSRAGRFDEAEPWIERALARAPHDPQLHYAVAGFYNGWGRAESERAYLRRMLRTPDLEPDLISLGHERMAASLLRDGRVDEARVEIEAARAVGLDATDWKGVPHYRLGLGPMTACWLRLEAASVELQAGQAAAARNLLDGFRADCGEGGRLRERLLDLEVDTVLIEARQGGGRSGSTE